MMSLTFLPVLAPLLAGIIILLARLGGLNLQRLLSMLSVLLLTFISLELMQQAVQGQTQVYTLGNWVAPFGIVLVLDQLSALMVLITSILALGALWYAVTSKIDAKGSHFHVLFQIQLFGLNGAFMTGDVFNLFVFFEVLLLASYGLLLHGGGAARTKGGLQYVVINLIGSTLFLFAVGTLYGILGTLNIADMAVKVSQAQTEDLGVIAAAGLLLLVVFGLKAAMFPLYLWLPQAYANTSAPVAALFAIMTKVGLYAIIRVHGTVFGDSAGELAHYYAPWVLGLGLITLLLAALGVMAARGLREQVTYLVLASVATLLIGLGLNSAEALAASLYYLIHSTLIAGGFFLLADIIARGRDQIGDRFISANVMPQAVLIGGTFIFGAIAMSGMPPLSGFFGKVLILSSALDHEWFMTILGIVLVSGLLMIVAVARSGSLLFYNTQPDTPQGESLNTFSYSAVVMLFATGIMLVIFAHSITLLTESTAQQLWQSSDYIQAVLNTRAVGGN
ncbi:MAG: monovalent cation/H+ antiporter subunit D [Thiomicrorhabdus chilensis]|uniref:monovalent cation/H+ antiporter subunit D n=1 Tax=Thiomicrorhabdus chilensis TaxID=63656 RepID=UPI00299F2E5A|nr:monovalent cation/H+ antiporter subunit D [Thiomicrorhabdus chilensis]MDX1348050.1 monovalent cation/H+ antiporter subunit D [Thiomicrorhabdus chilensis]